MKRGLKVVGALILLAALFPCLRAALHAQQREPATRRAKTGSIWHASASIGLSLVQERLCVELAEPIPLNVGYRYWDPCWAPGIAAGLELGGYSDFVGILIQIVGTLNPKASYGGAGPSFQVGWMRD